jgi:predicted DCC family thiol-disulfide oxidoreductase YuxK
LPSSKRWRSNEPPVVLFDDVCRLCNGVVRFIIARDPRKRFRFAPLPPSAADTILLIDDGDVFAKSSAVLRIARQLRFPWPLLYALIVFPRPWRDALYEFVARRRYRWFGKTETCLVPGTDVAERFVTVDSQKLGRYDKRLR